jgi:hypothetical protein
MIKSFLYNLHQITIGQIINYPWKLFTTYMFNCVTCNNSMTHSSGNYEYTEYALWEMGKNIKY